MGSQSDVDTSSHTTGRTSSSKARVQIVGRVSGRRSWTVEQKLAIIGSVRNFVCEAGLIITP